MPRSGTTYLSCILHNPPSVITISEAQGRWKQFIQDHGHSDGIFEIFAEFREKILRGNPVPSVEGTPGFRGHKRVDTWSQKKKLQRMDANPDFVLGMKNPEVFLTLLDIFLQAHVKCVISVRHPLFVINSWVKQGRRRLTRGASLEGTFANGDSIVYQSKKTDAISRRIDLHNTFAGLILDKMRNPNIKIVPYEDWFSNPGQLSDISRFLGVASLGYLRPAPIAPDPLTISIEEQERIREYCTMAGEFGYPVENGILKTEGLPVSK